MGTIGLPPYDPPGDDPRTPVPNLLSDMLTSAHEADACLK